MLTCGRDEGALADAAEAWRGLPGEVLTVAADVATSEGRAALVARARELQQALQPMQAHRVLPLAPRRDL